MSSPSLTRLVLWSSVSALASHPPTDVDRVMRGLRKSGSSHPRSEVHELVMAAIHLDPSGGCVGG